MNFHTPKIQSEKHADDRLESSTTDCHRNALVLCAVFMSDIGLEH